MKTLILLKLLIISLISLLQGCDNKAIEEEQKRVDEKRAKCNTQGCEHGIVVINQCLGRYDTQSKLIVVDENGEALRCKTNNIEPEKKTK